ncbi:hypothetical protein [Cecembia sp.]|uniref:hypothetical protein n=1 Tax=Cecembia sp. TaxID=1898110 RepID=UPI0025BCD60C|nr:hypothetical protein [Cecembia sp.]
MVVLNRLILVVFLCCFCQGVFGQISFGERIETIKEFTSQPVWIEISENHFIAYQTNVIEAARQIHLNVFLANQDFTNHTILDVPLRWSHVIKNQKVYGDKIYFLCENTDHYLNENYLLSIDLNSKEVEELELKATIKERITDFEVLGNSVLLMFYSQKRLVAQVLEISTGKLFTVEDVFQPGMTLQKVYQDELSGVFNLIFNFRTRDSGKSYLMSTINKEGVLLRNYLFESEFKNRENIEVLLSGTGPLRFIAGTVGMTNRVGYNGYYAGYLAEGSDPFNNIFEINDLPAFFAFEKDGGEKSIKKWEKSKKPSLNGILTARNLIENDYGFLLYSDHFLAVGNSHLTKDGVYDHNYYHFNPIKDMNYGRRGGVEPQFAIGTGERIEPRLTDPDIYFSFKSSHFIQFDSNGEVLWDYAIPLPKKSTFVPLSYGQFVSGSGDHFIYEFDGKLFYSQIIEGEIKELNKEIEIPGPQKSNKILKVENYDLELKSLNNGAFLLTGRQKVRFVDDRDGAVDKVSFIFQELKVDDF